MRIALDYDGTFSEDPETWSAVVQTLQNGGHQVVCVTKRVKECAEDVHEAMNELGVEVVFVAALKTKRRSVMEKQIHIDVWIDNNPAAIVGPLRIPKMA